jgi:putative acyl-CoA dehydrogenase
LRRIMTPLAKFWVTKRCTEVVHEALECLGGNGYVEESILPRLLRESPLNAIWEGSGNVIALDVLRAAETLPESIDALAEELMYGVGSDPRLDRAIDTALSRLRSQDRSEARARMLAENLAIAWQGSLLARFGRPETFDAFVRTRIGAEGGTLYGTLPHDAEMRAIVEPAIPRFGD